MAVQVSYPGVYIDEFAPAPPIQGVGTSTAAFIGVAARGAIAAELPESFKPARITSWDQFKTLYGENSVQGFFLWYAVRGFFQNGGQTCYVIRASNGDYDETTLQDRDGNNLILVRADQPGDNTLNPIQVEVTEAHIIQNTTLLFQPTGTLNADVAAGAREVTLQAGEGINFKPDDYITIAAGGERLRILRVMGDLLRLADPLANAYSAGDAVRLDDAPAGIRTIRIRPVVEFQPNRLIRGTILTIAQGATNISQVVESVQTEPMGPGNVPTYRVIFRQGLSSPLSLDPANPATVQSEEFNFQVTQDTASTLFENLSVDSAHQRYFVRIINAARGLVEVELVEPIPAAAYPNNLPANTGGAVNLAGGRNENLSGITDQNFTAALDVLDRIDDVNLVTIPDAVTLVNAAQRTSVQQAVIAHCERMQDRFGVLDGLRPVPNQPLFGAGSVEEQRQALDSSSGYAALYYPWLRVSSFTPGAFELIPPSGHICGIIARSDSARGVHKAPANEIVNGALDAERNMSDIDQGLLNLQGINVIRVFQGGGRPILWGARTTATDLNWQYVNIRRLFLFLEESIEEGIRWAVFEPNNLALWQKLKRTIRAFLMTQWRDGAIFGETPEKAFYVRIDEVLNPFSEKQLGRLHIEIGIRPSYPAEFIIVRIGIWDGGSEISEG